jgi:hypothetical protein
MRLNLMKKIPSGGEVEGEKKFKTLQKKEEIIHRKFCWN